MTYSDYESMHGPQARWFDGGPTRLMRLLLTSAALCGGMLLGGYLTQSHMREVVYQLEAELNALDSELGDLQREAEEPPPQQRELEILTAEHDQLKQQLATAEEQESARRQRILQAVHHTDADRAACLSELQRFVEHEQSLTAADVVRFAETMFASRKQLLLAIENPDLALPPASPAPLPDLSGSGAGAIADSRGPSDGAGPHFASTADTGHGPIPQPHDAGGHPAVEADQRHAPQASFHFDPPPARRTSYTYCPPGRRSQIASTEQPRVVFSDHEATSGRIVR